ncbi:hypothetical protein AB9F42_02725 [Rhizobium leguminosarum]|uniref:hypothetical protein n=1 Tax=Rhizobium leguminosarum TaxID=384 RepID=UPI003F9E1AD0
MLMVPRRLGPDAVDRYLTCTPGTSPPSSFPGGVRRTPHADARPHIRQLGLIFPEEEERPTTGYDRFAIRHSFDFEDEIEVFDVTEEFDTVEGLLRYRAQDLGDDEKARAIIADGVREYLAAAYQQMLLDPKSKLDIAQELDDLFLERDWTSFVSREDLKTPEVRVSDVELLDRTDADECLVRFHYVNGEKSGYEIEFVDIKKGRLTVRKMHIAPCDRPCRRFEVISFPLCTMHFKSR